jgi:peptidoglycan hydrolase-like protein with peptidoglycan-binding domain
MFSTSANRIAIGYACALAIVVPFLMHDTTPVFGQSCESTIASTGAVDQQRPAYQQHNLVRAIARELTAQGYFVGEANEGKYSNEMKRIVTNIQRKEKLPATGFLDCKTVMTLLGVDLSKR